MRKPAKTIIIGIGNHQRGDDALGLVLAQALAEETGLPYTTEEHDLSTLYEKWEGYREAWLCDAYLAETHDAALICRNAAKAALPADFKSLSTHTLSLTQAIELARALRRMPAKLMVAAVPGFEFGINAALSPKAEGALKAAIAALRKQLVNYILSK
jgi:hydrogenase maturation protease